MSILAQATQSSGDPSWTWWVSAVCMPILVLMIGWMIRRLSKGDEKFELMGKTQAAVDVKLDNLKDTTDRVARKIDGLVQQNADARAVFGSQIGELKAEFERDFLRRSEFQRHEDADTAKHAEILEAINQVKRV